MQDLTTLAAHQLSALLAKRALSPVELMEAFLARIDTLEPALHAYTEVYRENALAAARAAEAAIGSGLSLGPLHGIPVALKDLIELEGQVVTGGSEARRTHRATRTATLARHLLGQGLILLGKTHTVEFAMGGWGTNTRLGTPWNPWDPKVHRTPGGSSSGSGVAVAAGLAPWAVGTDTGGSVRVPAAWCGITGLKTSAGRVSTDGVLPLSPTLDTVGPMTRGIEDAALLYGALQGGRPGEGSSQGLAARDPMTNLKRGIRGLRLACLPEVERQYASAEVLAAYDASLKLLQDLGAEIVTARLPCRLEEVAAYNFRIMAAESYALYHALVDDEQAPLDPHVRPRIAAGRDIRARDYIEALDRRRSLKHQYGDALVGIDALVTPTTMTAAVPVSEVDQKQAPAHFTRFCNFLDLSAVALPNGFTDGGLPLSLQIICATGEEALALRIGWAVESATDWHRREPPTHAVRAGSTRP